MKRILKKILSFNIAATIAISIAATASAAEAELDNPVQTDETVRIGRYDCKVVDGNYITEIDGGTCIVIDLDEIAAEAKKNAEASPLSVTSSGWLNGEEIDVSDGHSYSGMIDISNGDDHTPIFVAVPKGKEKEINRVSHSLYSERVFPNLYKICIHSYSANLGWMSVNRTINFSLVTRNFVLFEGSATDCSKMCVTFYKDGSTGREDLEYTMYTTVWYKDEK